jgi:hypothetical protein
VLSSGPIAVVDVVARNPHQPRISRGGGLPEGDDEAAPDQGLQRRPMPDLVNEARNDNP